MNILSAHPAKARDAPKSAARERAFLAVDVTGVRKLDHSRREQTVGS
jgi:hypothetical protein